MFTGQFDVISNKATWASKVIELLDEDNDDEAVDLADSNLTVDIGVYIKDLNGCQLVLGTIANGKVTIVGPGFQFQFEVDDLSALCAGTYICGIKVTVDDYVDDLVIGTVAVLEGN